MYKKKLLNILLFFFLINFCWAQEQVMYKKADTTSLFLEIYNPLKMELAKKYPAMIFFFGGGWKGGNRSQFVEHAKYFSQRGIVCFLADYRIENQHGTTPFDSLEDAKSAIRYIRKNAVELGIDPQKIIASGGSAGGHLAAATALIEGYDNADENLGVSSVPQALVLFNPVIDNGPGGYGYERIGERYKAFSPLHNIKKGAPPTILFLGTEDKLIPVVTAQYYKMVMEKVGSRCNLRLYEKQGHGFFNYNNTAMFQETVKETDWFLQSLDYLTQKTVLFTN
ncbi:alpha/beta hydrolase [Pareuzebyella sediminis]|uniref:alpha/beta hydrolase n=1 Tax=Pareuzebyella sediminis TaxID=2607998 RepID=UPI0011EC3C3F|nr:alpha/beta hydrolase [Pareuzebyella sediminis]